MAQVQKEGRFGVLKRDGLSIIGAVALAMAFMAPAGSTFFETQPAAAGAGYAIPFAFILAMIVCLMTASTIAAFAKKLPSAGFAYTFNTHGLGKRGGFLSGWLLVLAYGVVGGMIFPAIGGFINSFLQSQFSLSVPWWLITLVFVLIIWGVMALGVSQTAKTALIFLILEVGVVAALALTVIGKGGAQGLSLGPFNPANSLKGFSGIGTGVLWGILAFVGFESAGTLGEETQHARRNVPRALFTAATVIGLFYVLNMYAAAVGYGHSHVGALVNDTTPWFTLAKRYWGPGVDWILALTVINSIFANSIAGSNAAVRVIFSLGREGIFPTFLGRTDRRDNPVVAITAYLGISLVLGLVVGLAQGPFGAFSFFGTILGVGIVLVWMAMSIGVIRFYAREYPREFSILRHGIIPVVAALLLLLPLYGQVWPIPPFPNNLVPYIVVAWVIAGVAYVLAIEKRRPDVYAGMGRVWGERGEEAQAAAHPRAADSTRSHLEGE